MNGFGAGLVSRREVLQGLPRPDFARLVQPDGQWIADEEIDALADAEDWE
jgi:hypothetical protein